MFIFVAFVKNLTFQISKTDFNILKYYIFSFQSLFPLPFKMKIFMLYP